MSEKPPPYNPYVGPTPGPPMGPPPPYQQMPPAPPPAGFFPTHPGSSSTTIITTQQPSYGAVPVVVNPVRATDVIVIGGCPACRVGVLNEDFTLAGLCCAFWFFPIGILCCLAMRERRCSNCGACFT
ncbi:brain protein I3-like [Homarus americanus]|uniref:Membrane protein BRI3 n=1 Tax=Homarus americanus TaxID=6706 RepID=A0A8J5TI82_HOMAM|nr:brain protein I3-like [Homarus americanus]KAG7175201.1 Brain protein I3-like 1 [Homarus americanus]